MTQQVHNGFAGELSKIGKKFSKENEDLVGLILVLGAIVKGPTAVQCRWVEQWVSEKMLLSFIHPFSPNHFFSH